MAQVQPRRNRRHRVVQSLAPARGLVMGGALLTAKPVRVQPADGKADAVGVCTQAPDLDANAVLAIRFATAYVMANVAEILAYGTAVTIERE